MTEHRRILVPLDLSSAFAPFPDFGGPTQRFVLPLVVRVDDKVIPVGTGFVLNPRGLFVTAAHVLHEANSKAQRRRTAERGWYNYYEFYALYINDEQRNPDGTTLGGFLPVDRVWAPTELDIGLGWLRLPVNKKTGERLPLITAEVSPGLISERTPVVGLGYHTMRAGTKAGSDGARPTLEITQDTAISHGRVVEVYPERREGGMLSFPCFRTDARFDPGMSGGPIMTQDAKVVGVICSGDSWSAPYVSHGSLIWPIFGCEIEVARNDSSAPEPVLLYDLAKEGNIVVDETFSQVTVERLPTGTRRVGIRSLPANRHDRAR